MCLSILESLVNCSSELFPVTQMSFGIAERYSVQKWGVHKLAAHPGTPVV